MPDTFNIWDALEPQKATRCVFCGEPLRENTNATCLRAHGLMFFAHGLCADRARERLEEIVRSAPVVEAADFERGAVLTDLKEKLVRSEIETSIRSIIAAQCCIPEESVTAEASLDDLGADSIDRLQITLDVERRFDVDFGTEEGTEPSSLRELTDLVVKHRG